MKSKKTTETAETFRVPGHMVDMKLRKIWEDSEKPIYDSLNNETKKLIEKRSASIDLINEKGGVIELSGSEWKMIDVLSELLHEKSVNNSDPNKGQYYYSMYGYELVPYGSIEAPAQRLRLTSYEIAKKYKGDKNPSGKDIETVNSILNEWNSNVDKRVLIRYKREIIRPDKSKNVKLIEAFQPLVIVFFEEETEIDPTGSIKSKSREMVILLNPIFRDQIESKYINYPVNLTRMMVEAWGGHDIPELVFKLRDYLSREISSKRFRCEINLENLYWILSPKSMKDGKRKRVHQYLEKAIEALMKIKLIIEYLVEKNKKGEDKAVFVLNAKWGRDLEE